MRESLQTKSFMIDVKVQDIVPLAEPMEAIKTELEERNAIINEILADIHIYTDRKENRGKDVTNIFPKMRKSKEVITLGASAQVFASRKSAKCTEKLEVDMLLALKANKKMDLRNIVSKSKSSASRNHLKACVKKLTDKHGATVDVVANEDSLLTGIFFQDKEMKDMFAAYPEILFIDATYRLLQIRFPVYLLLCEDGNGQSEIVAVFLLLEENQLSLKCMITFFKNHNPQW
uniref:ZSWIM1/3 RNaseH-like domain-containing protein n=1 Tax=Amphimedon queenslandica TaxID=400682 RepID=A0A1X7VH59_AMPQE